MARELTKLHEEMRRGPLDALAAHYAAAGEPRGEIVIVVGPAEGRETVGGDARRENSSTRSRALRSRTPRLLSRPRHGLPRRQVYARALALAGAQR